MKSIFILLALCHFIGMSYAMPQSTARRTLEARGICIDPIEEHEAQSFLDRNVTMWKRETAWQKLAKELYAKDFQLFSNSIASSTGTDIDDQPVYKSLAGFMNALEKDIPSTEKQITVGFWIDCHELVWLRNIRKVAGDAKFETQDFSVFYMQRSKSCTLLAKSGLVEYDSIPWGEPLGGGYTPPPAREDGKNDYECDSGGFR